jgi:predicted dithiol-disulfide oxidoreductase (DUF899 family)
MSMPPVVSREEWLTARKALLVKEKEFTDARDALSARRRELPMVEVDKDYVFDGQSEKSPPGRPQSPSMAWLRHHDRYAENP